jgi:hypothetical protein
LKTALDICVVILQKWSKRLVVGMREIREKMESGHEQKKTHKEDMKAHGDEMTTWLEEAKACREAMEPMIKASH